MFLFIGESIGMQELILIGVVALIVFGPRKLPEMAKTIGKMMAEFRKATGDFKETWQKEIDFEGYKEEFQMKPINETNNSIAVEKESSQKQLSVPEIKEIRQEEVDKMFLSKKTENITTEKAEVIESSKTNWL